MTKFLESLSHNFAQLLENGDEYNTIFHVGEGMVKQSFKVHSVVLQFRCPHLYNELKNIPYNGNFKEISKFHISAKVFEILIKYIYTGIVSFEPINESTTFDLLITANEFGLEELVVYAQSYLIENNVSWLQSNSDNIIQTSFNSDFKILQTFYIDFVSKDPNVIFESKNFKTLPENALVTILEQDDLQLEEIQIWDLVIQWGVAQNSNLPQDLSNWSDENFSTLKSTLQHCLPLIRYFQIPDEDFSAKILPYQRILDPNLWDDIITRFEIPNASIVSNVLPPRFRKLASFSTLITEEHAAEIASHIDQCPIPYDVNRNPYEFKLILRGSRDGFSPKTFWDLCNNIDNTVIVLKVNGTSEILGGYNSRFWYLLLNIPGYNVSLDSFIFSLKNGNLKRSIFSYINDSLYGIYCSYSYGPCFGSEDLIMSGEDFKNEKGCSCKPTNYKQSIRRINDKFSIDEYEVFQVVRKFSDTS